MVTARHDLAEHLARAGASRVVANEPLARRTTFRIGGPACLSIEVGDADGLAAVLRLLAAEGVPHLLLGGGSNVLAPDAGFAGVVLTLAGALAEVRCTGTHIVAGAGAPMRRLAAAARDASLAGFESAATIPGTVGGALAGNAGYAGAPIGDRVVAVRLLRPDGSIAELPREELRFAYRCSSLEGAGVILGATLCGSPGERAAIVAEMRRLAAERRRSQPLALPSAGCVFANPPGEKAGRLIDRVGLKGFAIGGAQVSGVHANFIVNRGGARAQDVRRLMAAIVDRVRAEFGITLVPEIEIIPGDRCDPTIS